MIVDRHGYLSDPATTAVQQGSIVVKKSHAVHSDRLSPKAAASVRHDGVGSVRSRSADVGKTIVVLFVVVCPLPGLRTAYFCLCDTVLFGVGSHKCYFYKNKKVSNISVVTCVLIIPSHQG